MQKAKVLVIEKDPDVGLIIKEIINRELHHISMTIGTAEDLLAAEEMLSIQDYDVVVLGSGLGPDGWLAGSLAKDNSQGITPEGRRCLRRRIRGNFAIGQRERSLCLRVEGFNTDS